ncbi:MAG: hypothetical protein K6F72_03350, partial [Bacteroidales bacterium]|nr:hypothetical protein [Bacteroidales bacterium]
LRGIDCGMRKNMYQIVDGDIRSVGHVAGSDNGCFRDGYIVTDGYVSSVQYHGRSNHVSFSDAYFIACDGCEKTYFSIVSDAELVFAYHDRTQSKFDVLADVVAAHPIDELFDNSGKKAEGEHFCYGESIAHRG